ncbi:MAG: hypothetical protein AB8H03_12205 [Saprospiraceae bacterium]
MNFFEKNIKDRFKNASSLDGVDPDDLWKNIESSIVTESPKKRFFYFEKRYWFLLIALFIIGGATIWNFTAKESISNVVKNDLEETTQFQNKEEKNIENKNVTQLKKNDVNEEQKIENSTFSKSDQLVNSSSTILSRSENKDQSITPISKNDFLNTIPKNSNSIPSKIQNTNLVNDELKEDKTQITSSPIQNDIIKNEQLFNGQKIDFTKIKFTTLFLPNENEDHLALNELINLSNFNNKKSKFSLGIFTGIHTLKNKFSTNITSEKERRDFLNQGYQLEMGHSFAIEASIHFNKNIFITSGFEYLKSKSEFNFIRSWDTIIVNPNSPIGILTDASATRTIKHHNKMNYFSIPILLGFEKSFRKIKAGMSAGVGLNFTRSQTGKSLDFNDQIVFYPTTENDFLPISTFFLSYHLRPYLSYDLDEKISFQLRTDFRYQNFGESDFYQLKYSSIFWGFSGGVQYSF